MKATKAFLKRIKKSHPTLLTRYKNKKVARKPARDLISPQLKEKEMYD